MLRIIAAKASAPFTALSAAQTPFARSFRDGLIGGTALFLLLAVWMFLRSPDTAEKIQPLIPHKTVPIESAQTSSPGTDETPRVQDADVPITATGKKTLNGDAATALPQAPIEGLAEQVNGRTLPLIRMEDDMTPFQAYKAPFEKQEGKNLISFVVTDFGLSSKLSQNLLENLPPEITLAVSPYADNPAKWGDAARAAGHEFWLELPMQRKDGEDSGPMTIRKDGPFADNERNTVTALGQAIGYAGIVTGKNHILRTEDLAASPVLNQIFGRGLAIAESTPEIAAFGLSRALEDGSPYIQNNFWIDESLDTASIDRALAAIEQQAATKGKAIAFFHPYPVVVQRVQAWMDDAQTRGIQFAPLSAMAQ